MRHSTVDQSANRAQIVGYGVAAKQLPAGIDKRAVSPPTSLSPPARASRCAAGSADLTSAAAILGGHVPETSHTRLDYSAGSNAYPPTPSTPLAFVVTSSVPSSCAAGKDVRARLPRRATQPSLPARARRRACAGCRHRCASPSLSPRPGGGGDGVAVAQEQPQLKHCQLQVYSLPTSVRTAFTFAVRVVSVRACCAIAARSSVRFDAGHGTHPTAVLTLNPRAIAGSPASILAGVACRPSCASPSAASWACTCARVPGAAGLPPTATVHC
eukprot:6205914-Pleurochrysis_carterae.AAC.1